MMIKEVIVTGRDWCVRVCVCVHVNVCVLVGGGKRAQMSPGEASVVASRRAALRTPWSGLLRTQDSEGWARAPSSSPIDMREVL